jgi:maltose alpha-D-glucosyltransferase/alpha-amylase
MNKKMKRSETNLEQLKSQLPAKRWFRQKASSIQTLNILDQVQISNTTWALVECVSQDAMTVIYSVVLEKGKLVESYGLKNLLQALSGQNKIITQGKGFVAAEWFSKKVISTISQIQPLSKETSNSLWILNQNTVAKMYRTPQSGENPDVEIPRELSGSHFKNVPALYGVVYYVNAENKRTELVSFSEYISEAADLWTVMLQLLGDKKYENANALIVQTTQVLADLHIALSGVLKKNFKPLAASGFFWKHWFSKIDQLIKKNKKHLPENEEIKRDIKSIGLFVTNMKKNILQNTGKGLIIRQHGDFHLGQMLKKKNGDFFVIDFEGEPLLPQKKRRQKYHPFKDVAGFSRSLHYAASTTGKSKKQKVKSELFAWYLNARNLVWETYRQKVKKTSFYSGSSDHLQKMFELERALYELDYEIQNRPDWVQIPLEGIRAILK